MKNSLLLGAFALYASMLVAQRDENNAYSSHQRAGVMATRLKLNAKNQEATAFWYCLDHGRHGSPENRQDAQVPFIVLKDEKCVQVGKEKMTLQEAISGKNPVLSLYFAGGYELNFTNLTEKPVKINIQDAVVIGDVEGDLADLNYDGLKPAANDNKRDEFQERFWVAQDLYRLGYLKNSDRSRESKVKVAYANYCKQFPDDASKYELEMKSETYLRCKESRNANFQSIADFQQLKGLPVTGYLDAATNEKLEDRLKMLHNQEDIILLGYLAENDKGDETAYQAAVAKLEEAYASKEKTEVGELLYMLMSNASGALGGIYNTKAYDINSYQAKNGLAVTGVWDKATNQHADKMNACYAFAQQLEYLGYAESLNYPATIAQFAADNGLTFENNEITDELFKVRDELWQEKRVIMGNLNKEYALNNPNISNGNLTKYWEMQGIILPKVWTKTSITALKTTQMEKAEKGVVVAKQP